MKKILYIIGVLLAFASCTNEETAMQEQEVTEQTFNVAISEPDYAPQTRAAVTMSRYLLEMYEGDLNGDIVNMESTDGKFDVSLKKGVDYLCLFWADEGTDAYNVSAGLQAIAQKNDTKRGTAAYWARVTVNSNNFNGNITLKRAVAELSFIDKKGLTEANNTLKITYPYAKAVMNLSTGIVGYAKGTPVVHTLTGITPPSSPTEAFASDFILAPAEAGKLTGLKLQLNNEEEKTIAEAVIQANYKTKITGEYEGPLPSMSFTINTDPSNNDDKTFALPLQATLSGYSLIVDWGDGNTETFADGTELKEANMTHTYDQAGKYTVTITSTQRDGTKPQMPKLDFYNLYGSTQKLLSLDTPLLNMGADLEDCFAYCMRLTTISAGLFDNNPDAETFSGCFESCTELTGTIPAGLFANNTKVKSFYRCFAGCKKLTGSIPERLFVHNTAVTDFSYCFLDCTGLTGAIPSGLFTNNTAVTHFAGCFNGCTGLTGAIPGGLFIANTAVTHFTFCFAGCTGLTGAIPEKLFTTNTAVTNFNYCFGDCTGLTEAIPGGLFTNNKAVTTFAGSFSGCTGLTGAIPGGLFTNNTAATMFSSCFNGCTGLTGAIPEKLFATNTTVTDFSYCFYNCKNLKPTVNIFCDETTEKTTRFAGKTVSFPYCFYNCGADTDGNGTFPALWSYTLENSNSYNTGDCFTGAKAGNADKVPGDGSWGTPATATD